MKLLKLFIWIASVLVVLSIGMVVVLTTLVDPNEYKPNIQQLVESQTGRQLDIQGDLELTFYPWIGLKTGELTFSNAKGFDDAPMLSVAQANIKVKLIPLLKKQLQVGDIVLTKPVVYLTTDRDGKTNWQDLLEIADNGPGDYSDGEKQAIALTGFVVQGVSLIDAQIYWDNRKSGDKLEFNSLNLTTSEVTPGKPVDFELSSQLLWRNQLAAPAQIELDATVTVNPQVTKIIADNIRGEAAVEERKYVFSVPNVNVDLQTEKVAIDEFKLTHDDTELSGNLRLSSFASPAIDSALTLDIGNIVALLGNNGFTLDIGQHTIGAINSVMNVRYLNNQAELNSANLTVELNGQETKLEIPSIKLDMAQQNLKIPQIQLKQPDMMLQAGITVDQIFVAENISVNSDIMLSMADVASFVQNNHLSAAIPIEENSDGFLQSVTDIAISTKVGYSNQKLNSHDLALEGKVNSDLTNIKLAKLVADFDSNQYLFGGLDIKQDLIELTTDLSLQGDITQTEKLKLSGPLSLKIGDLDALLVRFGLVDIIPKNLIKAADLNTHYELNNGALMLSSLRGTIDQTKISGDIGLAKIFTENEMVINLDQDLENLDIGRILSALEISEDLNGVGNVDIDLKGFTPGAAQATKNLNGNINFQIKDGAIKGFDLQSKLIKLDQTIKSLEGREQSTYTQDAETRFSELSSGFIAKNGVLTTDNFSMKAPALRVQGRGDLDFPRQLLDLAFEVFVVKTVEGQGGASFENLEGVSIPLDVDGKLTAPNYRLDLVELVKRQAKKDLEKVKEKFAEEYGEEIEGDVRDALKEKLSEKLEQKLGNELKKLFGD